MKATLEFQLPEEEAAFTLATSQGACSQALGDFRAYLEICISLKEESHPDLQIVWDTLHNIMAEYKVEVA